MEEIKETIYEKLKNNSKMNSVEDVKYLIDTDEIEEVDANEENT